MLRASQEECQDLYDKIRKINTTSGKSGLEDAAEHVNWSFSYLAAGGMFEGGLHHSPVALNSS